jgi:apolipoprotein D and lipocalin family protein
MRYRSWARALGRTAPTTILFLGVLASVAAPGAEGQDRPVEVVPGVDLDRYAGVWHEIAHLPNRFQDDCGCCVTATYTRREDGHLTVVNACRTVDGKPKAVEGEAKLASEDGPSSKLKVRFAPRFLSFLGFVWGDYWVLDLDQEYSYALVGSPDRKYLWVLAREPRMDEETYTGLLEKAGGMGFDVTRVQRTEQED